jgi:membrane protease subunit HflK
MPWSNQNGGGGPWGGGGSGGSGGGGKGPWGAGGGGGQQPPDIEELLRRGQDRMKKIVPGGGGSAKVVVVLILLAALGWMATGTYTVAPDEQGIELVFGKVSETTGPGLHWNWPTPVGDVEKPRVTQVNNTDIGFVSGGDSRTRSSARRGIPEQSLILTGDQNIVDIHFTVQWKIKDAVQYLFNIRDPDATVKIAAESAMREVVGQVKFDWAVQGEGRGDIQMRTRQLLQDILDTYQAGIEVREVQLQQSDPPKDVIDAFNDVQRARQDKERLQNEAQAYANSIVPEARGQAEQVVQQATAYREQQVKEAEGEAQRFLSVYEAYLLAPDVTRRRMYLETMGAVFGDANKIIIDKSAGGSGVVPYLPLPEIQRRAQQPAAKQ